MLETKRYTMIPSLRLSKLVLNQNYLNNTGAYTHLPPTYLIHIT